ncbi:MAG: alpha/beta hydrolase [Burkholderiales bacterium]
MLPPKSLPFIELETAPVPDASVILLHGGGGSGSEFVSLASDLVCPEHRVRFIFPHAPHIPFSLFGGHSMRAWFDVPHYELERDQDEEGIRASEAVLVRLIEQEQSRGIPCSRILIGGFSLGGSIALHTGLRYRQALAGIMALSAYLPLAHLLDGESSACSRDTPVFIAHGLDDALVSIDLVEKGADTLRALGYRVDRHVFPMRHTVCPEEMFLIKEWIGKMLK